MLAYGIGELTPAEFGDLTPSDLLPYVNAKIKREEEQIKMENERIGTICAVLQNGIPIGYIKKGAKVHHPSDYFGKLAAPKKEKPEDPITRKSRLERIYGCMGAWVQVTKGGGK